MLNLVPSSLLLRPASPHRPPAKNPTRGRSTAKKDPGAPDGRSETHRDRPTTEGRAASHHRDVSAPGDPSLPPAEKEKPQPLLDLSPLRDPVFAVFTWSFVLSHLAYFVPTFHLVARARTLGIGSMDASYLMAAAGTSNQLPPTYRDNGTKTGKKGNANLAKK